VNHTCEFTEQLAAAVNDERLSWRAIGILTAVALQGRVPTSDELSANHKEGRDAVRAALRELLEAGYISRRVAHGERGRLTGGSEFVANVQVDTESLKDRKPVFQALGHREPDFQALGGDAPELRTSATPQVAPGTDSPAPDFQALGGALVSGTVEVSTVDGGRGGLNLTSVVKEGKEKKPTVSFPEIPVAAQAVGANALLPAIVVEPQREDVERLCTHLAEAVVSNGSRRPPVTKAWRNAARLLLDKDGRTEEQVHAAIDWCQQNEFWRAHILSMPKLREKYDQLRLQAMRDRRETRRSTTDQRVEAAMDLMPYFEELDKRRAQGEV
jgi:hypothetical protein